MSVRPRGKHSNLDYAIHAGQSMHSERLLAEEFWSKGVYAHAPGHRDHAVLATHLEEKRDVVQSNGRLFGEIAKGE